MKMAIAKLEYIWLDGYKPIQSLRSKTKIERNFSGQLEDCPLWCFDGSSTEQAPGGSSDCLLKPVYLVKDPQRRDGYLVMCEVLNPDGTAHVSNGRALIDDDDNDFWFGFEQEYFLYKNGQPLGFPAEGFPKEGQGRYYCGVGYGLMGDVAQAALAGGSDIQGIMPAFLQALEPQVSPQEKLIVTPHMQERKTLMLQMSDAFIVLPGGLGTFDEFFEVVTEAQLGVHAKPIIVVNVNGYFYPLDKLLHATIAAGFAKAMTLKLYYLADGAEAALEILEGALNAPARS